MTAKVSEATMGARRGEATDDAMARVLAPRSGRLWEEAMVKVMAWTMEPNSARPSAQMMVSGSVGRKGGARELAMQLDG